MPWHEEIGKSFLTLIYPSHLLARPSFFFFFFNLDVVDITSEILLLALQVCLSAKTLPPGSSFFLSNVNWAEYHKKLSQIPAIKHTEVDPPWN